MMDNTPVPDVLLQMIHCNCVGGCNTLRCSCKKYGLECTAACGSCQDGNCENMNNAPIVDKMRTETNNYDIYKAVIWCHGMNDILDNPECHSYHGTILLDTINVWTHLSQ